MVEVVKIGVLLLVDFGTHFSLASISRLSPSKHTNCSVTFDPP